MVVLCDILIAQFSNEAKCGPSLASLSSENNACQNKCGLATTFVFELI